jgi:integrase
MELRELHPRLGAQASVIKISRIQREFNEAVGKCKVAGLNMAADFLKTKARRSLRTGLNMSHALRYFNVYTKSCYKMDLEQIVSALKQEKIDVYKMLNSFVKYLQEETPNGADMMPRTVLTYMVGAKSYLGYVDIDIAQKKFQYRVTMPSLYKEDEIAIDANDIREIVNHCDNKRLKTYLLVLASGGMRASEALAIREIDINWNGINFGDPEDVAEPASVKVRKEYSKTRRERHIFISNEAARYLNDWLEWKYRRHPGLRQASKNDLVFARLRADGDIERQHPSSLYKKMQIQFRRVLQQAQRGTKKEDGIVKRGLVTFHSFRRFVKTTIANQTRNDAYAEWFIGHAKSPYYTNKPEKLKSIYKEDCMRYLTFLEYPTVQSLGRDVDARLKEVLKENELLKAKVRHVEVTKESELQQLKQRDVLNTEAISDLTDMIMDLKSEVDKLKKQK